MMSGELLFYFSAHDNKKTQKTKIESRSKNQLIMIKCMHFRFAQYASSIENYYVMQIIQRSGAILPKLLIVKQ